MLSQALSAALRRVVDETAATRAAWRPDVAAYVYEAGLAPLFAALTAQGPVSEPLIEATWRLMLDTVGSRRFGISGEIWRTGDYPDRYFATLWLDVVPRALPAAPPHARLDLLVRLFNLGEHLTARARGVANQVAVALVESADTLHASLEAVVRDALVTAGMLQVRVPPPTRWRGLRPVARFDVARADPGFVPDGVEALPGRRFRVADALGAQPMVLRVVGGELRVTARTDEPPEALGVTLSLEGGAVRCAVRGEARTLAALDLVAPVDVAGNAEGDVLVVDGASAQLRLLGATA